MTENIDFDEQIRFFLSTKKNRPCQNSLDQQNCIKSIRFIVFGSKNGKILSSCQGFPSNAKNGLSSPNEGPKYF